LENDDEAAVRTLAKQVVDGVRWATKESEGRISYDQNAASAACSYA
jgi:hypothetical protein